MEKDDMCPLNDVNSIVSDEACWCTDSKWEMDKQQYIIKYFIHLIATQQIVIQTN